MSDFAQVIKEYWHIIVFLLSVIIGGAYMVWTAIKKKLPSLEKRVQEIEKNVFDEEGNRVLITLPDCKKEREVCNSTICNKIDKLEGIIKLSTKATTDGLKDNRIMFSANVKDLHEKREATTKDIKQEIAGVVLSVNTQINKLTLAVGKVQGQSEKN